MRWHGGPVILVGMLSMAVAGVALRRWELVAVAIPVFVIYGLGCLAYSVRKPRLSVRRTVTPGEVIPGKTAVVTLEVRNHGWTSPGMVEIYDTLPESIEIVKGKNHRIFSLGAYESKKIKYRIRLHQQGEIKLGPARWRIRDPMHFFFDEGLSTQRTPVMVKRGIEDVRRLKMPRMRTNRPFGQIPARVKGIGTEFYSLREYVPTDSFRTVNWKASARRGILISKEYEDERLGDVVLIVDMRPSSKIGEGSMTTVDATVNGALAVASRVLRDRHRLSIIYLRSGVGWIGGITSRRHISEIVEKADFPPELEQYPINWLPWMVKKSFHTKAFVVALTPLMDDDMASMLQEIALAGYDMLVLSPSPLSGSIDLYRKPSPETSLRISRKLVLLRRQNRILKLSKTVNVIDWNFDEPVALALKRLERRRGGVRWRIRPTALKA
jgi:uncharacterized protein (DUF58 family)